MKLISMTDFVLEQKKQICEDYKTITEVFFNRIVDYANFLRQPLTLSMFVPCDEKGNPLPEPQMRPERNSFDEEDMDYDAQELYEYIQAKEKVLFKDANITAIEDYFIVKIGKREVWISWTHRTIEDVQHINRAYEVEFELTDSALKQIGLNP